MAELLGGRRVPVSGRGRGDAPDVEHPTLAIEVKSRRQLPAWIEGADQQAEACTEDGQLPLAILHQDRRPYRESLVIIRLGDFVGYFIEGEDDG